MNLFQRFCAFIAIWIILTFILLTLTGCATTPATRHGPATDAALASVYAPIQAASWRLP